MKIDLGKLTLRQQLALGVSAVSIFALLCVWWLFIPQRQRQAELLAEYNQQKQNINVVETFSLAHPDIDRYISELNNKIDWVNKMLPDNPDIGSFIVYIENISKESGVQLVQLQPGMPLNKNGYREIPIEILVRGNYFQTLQFLGKLESLPRFSAVNNILIQSRSGVLENKLSVSVYCFGTVPNLNQPGSGAR